MARLNFERKGFELFKVQALSLIRVHITVYTITFHSYYVLYYYYLTGVDLTTTFMKSILLQKFEILKKNTKFIYLNLDVSVFTI